MLNDLRGKDSYSDICLSLHSHSCSGYNSFCMGEKKILWKYMTIFFSIIKEANFTQSLINSVGGSGTLAAKAQQA